MRQMISGLIAAIAVMAAGTMPAKACGGFFDSCGCGYVAPCATAYIPAYGYGCGGCVWWGYERLPDPAVPWWERLSIIMSTRVRRLPARATLRPIGIMRKARYRVGDIATRGLTIAGLSRPANKTDRRMFLKRQCRRPA
jgi:hypothetical protein